MTGFSFWTLAASAKRHVDEHPATMPLIGLSVAATLLILGLWAAIVILIPTGVPQ